MGKDKDKDTDEDSGANKGAGFVTCGCLEAGRM